MKKLTMAGLLAAALSLTALSPQKAAAWGCDDCSGCAPSCCGFSLGFNISVRCCCVPCFSGYCNGYHDSACCGYAGSDFAAYGYGCPTGDCGYLAAAYPSYPSYPSASPAAPAAPAVQMAGYNYPAAYGYGAFQAPSYWYGR